MISLGIDLSTSNTGVLALEGTKASKPVVTHRELISPVSTSRSWEKQRLIVDRLFEIIHHVRPDEIVVENYGLNLKNKTSIVPMVELGGLFRYVCGISEITFTSPTPGQIKQFVTGSGNGKKELIMMQVFKRWGFEASVNDEADAYACAVIGLAYRGALLGVTAYQREILGKIVTIK